MNYFISFYYYKNYSILEDDFYDFTKMIRLSVPINIGLIFVTYFIK